MDDTLGTKLKKLRESFGMTQNTAAERVGVSKKTISAYETDVREPSNDVLVRFARLYRVTTDYLLGIQKDNSLSVDGLEEKDIAMLRVLVEYMRDKNKE